MLTLSGFSSPASNAKGSTSNPCRRSGWASLAKSAVGFALAMGVLTAGQAQALIVTVGGQAWDVTTFTGTYNANTSKFALPSAGGMMPWWADGSLPEAFARAVGNSLGLPNSGPEGPFFAVFPVQPVNIASMRLTSNNSYEYIYNTSRSATKTWAQATQYTPPAPVPVRVPGPLPALGAAAAFGFSRQLRKRTKRSANAISSSYSL
ncbi:MAG: hypothetical protein NTZ40_10830 [Cyanobacteria bacterium]|nr:hypothetical protein [Cyanobacteriota bacterium]